jgi:hypothetical protein
MPSPQTSNLIAGKVCLTKILGIKYLEKNGRMFLEITDCDFFKSDLGHFYLSLDIWATPNGEFGEFRINQSLSKDQRASGVRSPILGNARYKIIQQKKPKSENSSSTQTPTLPPDDNPPF